MHVNNDFTATKSAALQYHRVDTYSVKGGFDRISRARPKSATLITSPLTSIFSGFISEFRKNNVKKEN